MIKNIAITLLLFVSFSCAFLIVPKINFTIKNNTSKDLKLQLFSKSELIYNINIKSYASFDTTRLGSSSGAPPPPTPFNEEKVDSMIVLFSDAKLLIYHCEPMVIGNSMYCKWPNKNPFVFTLTKTYKLKPVQEMLFTIDESDYANAKPL
jgi:hypothetical protein